VGFITNKNKKNRYLDGSDLAVGSRQELPKSLQGDLENLEETFVAK
jgi:hypothetical protein